MELLFLVLDNVQYKELRLASITNLSHHMLTLTVAK